MKIIPIIFLIFILSLNLYSFDSVSSDSDTSQYAKFNKFIELIEEKADIEREWIARKEIASWGALIVYLSILMVFSQSTQFLRNLKKRWKWIFLIAIFSLMLFFMLFIFKQYGSMTDAMGASQEKYYWIYKKTDNYNKAVSEFNNKIKIYPDRDLREWLNKAISERVKSDIRRYPWICKPFLPIIELRKTIYFLISKSEEEKVENKKNNNEYGIKNIEVQESIMYDIMLLLTIIFIVYICRNNEDGPDRIKRSYSQKLVKRRSIIYPLHRKNRQFKKRR